jgi:NAD(P)-dependent dehydrogenase (short-subunit alcohol dehydrogenase family)
MREFGGKVGVVTGAGRGIGFAVAAAMADRGMRVVLSDVDAARPQEVAGPLRDKGADAWGVVCDVSDAGQVDALAAATMERFGRVDLLCNNAGVVTGGPAWEIGLDQWRRVLGVNLWGVVHGVHSFVPLLLENPDGGHVVNVASMAAVVPWPGIAPYNVSKHGVLALSETLLGDLRAAGSTVGVSVVMPGRVATGIGLPSGAPAPEMDEEAEPGIISPDVVAAQIMTAVEEEQLYVFTHERMDQVAARFDAILGSPGGAPSGPVASLP